MFPCLNVLNCKLYFFTHLRTVFRFIAKQSFLVNLAVAVVLVFLLGLLFFQSLGWLTHHGESLRVPSVVGKNVDSAVGLLEDQGFDVIITDSLYNDSIPLNTVKKQLPDPGATVKVNRTVFLNVNPRSEEHTSELQSPVHLVCRHQLEKKKKKKINNYTINK